MSETKGVEAVDRALKIMDCFDAGISELSLAEIARITGFYKSTILRLSVSLIKSDYLVRTETGTFRLGPATWRLGSCYRQSFDLAEILRPALKSLCTATNETASFYIKEGDSRICLYRSEPERAIRHSINEGASMPLNRGASGRVLLAFCGNDTKDAATIRDCGYAISLGERDAEVAAISMPLTSNSGRLVGAIAVSGLLSRFDRKRQLTLIDALEQTRRSLADQITS